MTIGLDYDEALRLFFARWTMLGAIRLAMLDSARDEAIFGAWLDAQS